ncbi:MAG: ABC transporter ATP-binding protein [Eubacterium sp.]|nr:ABC transporter ATP-binding protein [Eubacterium sp.]MDE6767300.1 ABC transporter ATP-binding protein [Eubacterium sp.]
MIDINNVTKRFGDFTAIENISLRIDKSSIYGLVGYNGAGKTTLLKTCAGIYAPNSGAVLIDGENVYDNGSLRSNIFFVPDVLYFPRGASLLKMKDFYKGYYENFSEKIFFRMAEAMGLDLNKNLQSFSKGMQRQAEIILAMSTRPKFMLLDEVFDGIDPQKRSLCKRLFIEYMAETDCSILMSSHNLQEVADLCDHVALINGKSLALNVSVDDVSSAYKKYRLIFNRDVFEYEFSNIEYRNIQIDNRMVTIIVSSSLDKMLLESLGPIHIDCVTLSLEEVFLNEMEDRKYDISAIFSE